MDERTTRQVLETYLGNARSYRDMKDYDNALAEFTEATNVDPSNAGIFIERGHCYREKYHNGDRDHQNLVNAIDDFNRARQLLTGAV